MKIILGGLLFAFKFDRPFFVFNELLADTRDTFCVEMIIQKI